jgi:hypothetical protein
MKRSMNTFPHGCRLIRGENVGLGFIHPVDSVGRYYSLTGRSSGLRPKSARTS